MGEHHRNRLTRQQDKRRPYRPPKGQVSNFLIEKNIPIKAIKNQINKSLYGEVKVLEIKEVETDFNARFDAKKRVYVYVMKKKEEIDPFEADYIAGIKNRVDCVALEKIMKTYIGKHDFAKIHNVDVFSIISDKKP